MKKFLCLLVAISLLGLCSACSDSDNNGGPTTLSGTASKGPIDEANVKIYGVTDAGEKGKLLNSTTTDPSGAYEADLGNYNGQVIVEVEGGTYEDEATGDKINFANKKMRAAQVASKNKAMVTPFTELAVRKMGDKYSRDRVEESNQEISQFLGTTDQDSITDIEPNTQGTTPGEKSYGLLLAGFSQYMNNTETNVEDAINAFAEDLEDNKLDKVGKNFVDATQKYAKNHGLEDVSNEITERIKNIAKDGFKATGDLKDVKESLVAFLNSCDSSGCSDSKYDNFINTAKNGPGSEEAHLFKAVAAMADIYNSVDAEFITNSEEDGGLGLNFSSQPNATELAENLLQMSSLNENATNLFADMENRLSNHVDDNLKQAEGVDAQISLSGYNTVYFDDIDVKIMLAMSDMMKAGLAYMQAVNLGKDITWTDNLDQKLTNDTEVNSTDLITLMEDENNKDLLSYEKPQKLNDFKNHIGDLQNSYNNAFKALNELSKEEIRARNKQAFNISSQSGLKQMQFLNDKTLPSILNATKMQNQKIHVPSANTTSEKFVNASDGYWYAQEQMDIYNQEYSPANENDIIYNLANENEEAPRDILLKALKNDQYKAFKKTGSEIYESNATQMDLDDPYESYTIPQKDSISIDGDKTDWNSTSSLIQRDNTKLKLAQDGNDLYVYVYSEEELSNSDSLGLTVLSSEEDSQLVLYINAPDLYIHPTELNFEKELIKNNNGIAQGYEVKFSSALGSVIKKGTINRISFNMDYLNLKLLEE